MVDENYAQIRGWLYMSHEEVTGIVAKKLGKSGLCGGPRSSGAGNFQLLSKGEGGGVLKQP